MSNFVILSIASVTRLPFSGTWIENQLSEPLRRDLPAQAPAIAQPPALLDLASLLQGVPQAIDLGLIVAFDHDRKAVIERIERTGFDGHVALIPDREGRKSGNSPPVRLGVSPGIEVTQSSEEPGISDV